VTIQTLRPTIESLLGGRDDEDCETAMVSDAACNVSQLASRATISPKTLILVSRWLPGDDDRLTEERYVEWLRVPPAAKLDLPAFPFVAVT